MTNQKIYKTLTYIIAAVWLVNGLFCKVFNMVPRHRQIVARILGTVHSREITITIGVLETAMALWTLSEIKPRMNALSQIVIIAAMNTLEFFIAPDLLLWGKANAFFALLFIIFIYCNEFYIKDRTAKKA